MHIRECFLRFLILPILLFSAGAYAIPILQVNVANALGEVYFSKYNGGGMSRSEVDEMLSTVNAFWNGDIARNIPLSATYSGVFTLLYGFNTGFVIQFPGSDPASLTVLDIPVFDVTEINGGIGSSGDADDGASFLATLGIAMTDWQAVEEKPHAVSPQDPIPATAAITRQGSRNECPQPHYEHSQKPGSRTNLCAGGGGSANGGGGGVGGRGGPGVVAGRDRAGPGIGGSPGTGSNGPGIGTNGPGIGSDGPNTGGDGPRAGIGHSGNSGNSGSGGISVIGEVRTVPEPTTLALIGLGIANLCMVRRRKK